MILITFNFNNTAIFILIKFTVLRADSTKNIFLIASPAPWVEKTNLYQRMITALT